MHIIYSSPTPMNKVCNYETRKKGPIKPRVGEGRQNTIKPPMMMTKPTNCPIKKHTCRQELVMLKMWESKATCRGRMCDAEDTAKAKKATKSRENPINSTKAKKPPLSNHVIMSEGCPKDSRPKPSCPLLGKNIDRSSRPNIAGTEW